MLRIVPLAVVLLLFCPPVEAQRSPTSSPVRGQRGMVVSADLRASEAGVEVMRAGGNAADAAVATGFALAVTFPVAGNIGGGGFMVLRMPDGRSTTIDYREKAPAAATRDMFLDSTGTYMPDVSQRGHLASGVPGSVAGLLYAHETYGRVPLATVLAPAIRLARDGFALTLPEADLLNAYKRSFQSFEATARYFTLGPERRYAEGERFRQTDLADVLTRIRDRGHAGFYEGRTADLLVAEMQRGGGLITHADLKAYQPVERAPVVGSYRGHRIISMAPPSSGGIALMQLLRAVEPFDLDSLGFNSSATVHLMGEAMRRTYADRSEWLGDPDFVNVPITGLVDSTYVSSRMRSFDPAAVTPSSTISFGRPAAYESDETTHYSVVDDDGMAASVTTTLNGGYGSMVVVDGAGFFLNNEMDDFSAKPGTPNMFGLVGNEANAIQPGKRMLSSMTPTIVEDAQGRLLMVIGSPGGGRIITAVFQVIVNTIDHGMDIQEAVAAPRIHHQWLPDVMYAERQSLSTDVIAALQARGWAVNESRGYWAATDGIVVRYAESASGFDPSGLDAVEAQRIGRVYLGGADPRGEDAVAAY